jgi:hypothetical protein
MFISGLLKLYPPGWRRRYGSEFVELMRQQPFTIATTVDVIAGAIDAWVDPQMSAASHSAAGTGTGEKNMFAKLLRFQCAGHGHDITREDRWKSTIVTVGGTLVGTVVWMAVHIKIGDNAYVDALSVWPFMAAMLLGLRYTELKGRSNLTQTIFIGSNLAFITAIFLLAGWITTKL